MGEIKYQVTLFSPQRPYKTPHRPGYPVLCPRNHGHQRHHCLHHMSCQLKVNSRHQAALPGHDYQKRTDSVMALVEEILHILSAGSGRQERQKKVQGL
jgi:hypothetical protein